MNERQRVEEAAQRPSRNPSAFPLGRWHGHWIAADLPDLGFAPVSFGNDLPPAPHSRVQFRRELTLDSVPATVPARLTADSRYVLWVNGAEVGRGPVRSQPRRMRYDEYDLAPYLRPGRNVIAALVTYYEHANSFWQPAASTGVAGRDAQFVFEARLGDEWIVSDASWRAQRSRAWRGFGAGSALEGVPVEGLDARELDPRWTELDGDDSGWATASIVTVNHPGGMAESRPPTDPYGPLLPRGIASLVGETVVATEAVVQTAPAAADLPDQPAERLFDVLARAGAERAVALPLAVARRADADTVVTVDVGRIVAGFVELDVTAASGTRLDLLYQELAAFDASAGPVGSAPRTGASYVARGRDDRFRALELNGIRRISVLVPAGEGEVVIERIAVREHHYPTVGGASFSSSDAELERLYRAGIRTVEMNAFDAFTDCPTREQRAWVGDGVVHQLVHLTTNEDWRLARNYVELGASPRPDGILPMTVVGEVEYGQGFTIPDWALHWVHGVWNLHRYDGDRDATLRLLPVVERVLRWFEPFVDEHGTLSDLVEWNLIDWASVFSTGRSSLSTALWARALREYAELSDWVGNAGSAAWARSRYDAARAGFEDFWDEQRGSYLDHLLDGVPQRPMSQLAGATAIVSGLAPRERWNRILDAITDEDRLVVRSWIGGADGGYDMQKMLDQARGVLTADWDVEREIVIAQPFYSYLVHDAVAEGGRAADLPRLLHRWTQFLVNGYDTFGECWGWGTPVHGWSSTPTKDLVQHVLGVTPDEPGFARVRIAPRPGAIERIEGRVPTPHGLVSVTVDDGRCIVDAPVPIRFVALDGTETEAPAGSGTFPL